MGITLDQLVYDTSNPNDGANVGSYVKAGDDGTAIGHVSDALKVDLASSSLADFDIRDLTHVSDSVKVGDGTDFLAIAADGSIAVTDNGASLTVDSTDFDIRDLSASQDNVAISDGTDTLAVNGDGSLNAVVTATNLDIRDLTHASDSVKIGDGTDFLAVNADGSIDVKFGAPSNAKTSTATVGTSAVELAATPLASRTRILVQNNGAKPIYLGEDNTVTTSSGICLPKAASIELPFGAAANLWAISSAAGNDIRVFELD